MTSSTFDGNLPLKASTDYTNFTNYIESEMVALLESNALVDSAKVKVTDISNSSSNSVIVKFESACYFQVPEINNMTAISTLLFESITNSSLFWLTNEKPKIVEPLVIKIQSDKNETEIAKKIGKSINRINKFIIFFKLK